MFESRGTLLYDPHARIKFEPWWCILKTDEDIIRYYQAFIKQNYDLQFEKTIWGSHISVIRGVKPANASVWKKHHKLKIEFTYTNRVYRKHWFFCVDAYSKQLEDIREEMGLSRLPASGFHLTVGRINKIYLTRKKELLKEFFKELKVKKINYNLLPIIQL